MSISPEALAILVPATLDVERDLGAHQRCDMNMCPNEATRTDHDGTVYCDECHDEFGCQCAECRYDG